jgi:hypothetical protein
MAANVETITVTAAGRGSVHNTLDGTNADAITVNTAAAKSAVLATLKNRSADGTYHVGAGENYPFIVNGSPAVSIIAGSALAYSLQTAPATDG